ncbi:MAG: Serine/threonine-protein kinase PknB [Planctomycetes bacterium ADurb.Bin412]|nr:MAG: Serine/threonine-protein kinase PknB [Planctomycetes bacterium ADurb.Bin412]
MDCPACKRPVIVPQPVLDNGTSIGGFQIERRLGAGGMGEVFLARQLSMDRQVALKILPAHFAQNQTAKERFQSEVKNLARIQHGNIVTAIEAGEDTGVHFLAMTFVDGEDLHKRLDREKLIDEREALGIVRKVADTLRTVWEEYHILHRDIKPSNIMLDKRGDPKVMDLGLSKNLADNMSLTMTGAALGTPHYISPEQALNRTTIDFRSDIYSLGATLYHLTTGTLPYNGSSVAAIMIQHVNEPLPLPKERNPLLSDACSCLIETMMAKLPEHRHSSWSALIEDLDRVLAGLPPLTARPGPGQSVVGGMPTGFIHAKNVGREKRLMKPVSESVVPRWIIYAGIACLIFILLALIFALQRISNRKGRVPNVVAATELSGWPAAAENQGMRDVVAAEPMAGSQPRAAKQMAERKSAGLGCRHCQTGKILAGKHGRPCPQKACHR